MPLPNFPASPSNGDIYAGYMYDSVKGTWLLQDSTGIPTQISNLEDDVLALDGRVDTAEADITTLEGRMTTAEADITILETRAITLNANTISANYSIPAGYNGVSAGPITIASGVTVTIPTGSSWSIV